MKLQPMQVEEVKLLNLRIVRETPVPQLLNQIGIRT